jgi:molybdopterin-guanine dinucleotide biosynthesis protein A
LKDRCNSNGENVVKESHDTAHGFGAPVLAVCGFSGSGKTTLLEAAIPKLVERGLAVAVVKHDAHRFEVDKQGKDSDRLFRAGATVVLRGGEEQFERRGGVISLEATLARLGHDHDLLLVEGHKDTPLTKFWLNSAEQIDAPENVTNIVCSLAWDGDRLGAFMGHIDSWLPAAWDGRPLYYGLLIGGMSSRMGSPKQVRRFGGRELGEIAARALGVESDERCVIALGAGVLPESLRSMARIPDSPGFAGPGAGLIAAHRWAPDAAWIVTACDHPWLRTEHIDWLAAQRQAGRWAVIPRQCDGYPCPMLALYEPQALEALERQALTDMERNARPSALMELPRTLIVTPPPELADGWKNVNTPEELRAEEERISLTHKRSGEQSEIAGKREGF